MTPAREEALRRAIRAVAIGAVVAFLAFHAQAAVPNDTDFSQVWHAARGWLAGSSPYAVVGPGRQFNWPFPLLYPATAVLLVAPLALMPLAYATAVFSGVGSAALAWALGARGSCPGRWFLFASASFVYVLRTAQWTPLLMASALMPPAAWVLACKPSIGGALFAAFPSWRGAMLGAAFVAVSLLLVPGWPFEWLAALPSAYHMTAPVTYVTAGGPLILLALLRWRLPEARLLVALGCIPHTTMLHESLPLFLIASRWYEGMALAALTWVCFALPESRDYLQRMHETAWRMTLLLYLPCAMMVLLRKNIDASESLRQESGNGAATLAVLR